MHECVCIKFEGLSITDFEFSISRMVPDQGKE
jgi:hypothetical protein